ncbi:hypothetical protein BH11MYX1_BH11MYX1_49900 [soil metagenome]
MHDDVLRVNRHGHLPRLGRGHVVLRHALGNQLVGIREELDGRWLVTFVDVDLTVRPSQS